MSFRETRANINQFYEGVGSLFVRAYDALEAECSDFAVSAPAYGKELIIVARVGA